MGESVMKVFVAVGAKKNGNTDKIADQFIKGALAANCRVITEHLFLKKNMHGCIDCQSCKRNNGACVWKDDVPEMIQELIDADVIVLASPVYFFSISSQLKLFMDRTYAAIEKIKNKRVIFIATGEGPSDVYEEDFRRVIEPIQGFVRCFENTSLEKVICCFDMGTAEDITKTAAYSAAFECGASL